MKRSLGTGGSPRFLLDAFSALFGSPPRVRYPGDLSHPLNRELKGVGGVRRVSAQGWPLWHVLMDFCRSPRSFAGERGCAMGRTGGCVRGGLFKVHYTKLQEDYSNSSTNQQPPKSEGLAHLLQYTCTTCGTMQTFKVSSFQTLYMYLFSHLRVYICIPICY